MRRLWVLLGAAAMLALACGRAANYADPERPRFAGQYAVRAAPDSVLRVVSFNIQFARHIEAAIALLGLEAKLRAPDVLALQEMDEAGVERIGRALTLNYVYYPSAVHPVSGRNFGNAILSPWPILESRKLPLPHRSVYRDLERAAVVATIEVGGEAVRVYSVHLETLFALGDRERRDQVRAILADAARSPDPVIIAGDLNSHDLGAMFKAAGYAWPTARVGPTIAAFSWDHIFTRGLGRDAVAGAGAVRDTRGASDHRPVWVELAPAPSSS
jgi:endonuclease/exonuclease/phosphatase family metal-dependent hydrolase